MHLYRPCDVITLASKLLILARQRETQFTHRFVI